MSTTSTTPTKGTKRIVGLDVARAIALMGMIISHLWMPLGPAGELFNGFPAALFAVLAGVSLSIMASRGAREGGVALATSRHGLMVRGALLIVLHHLITPYSGTISVVLQAFGICYIALACVPRWTNRSVAVLLAWLVGLFALVHAVSIVTEVPDYLTSPYPVITWAASTRPCVRVCS